MSDDLTHASDPESRRNEVLLAYIEACQDGQEPDHEQFLAAHSDLRRDLELFFADHDELRRLTSPLRAVACGTAEERGSSPSNSSGAADTALGELGDFRLLREVGRGGMGIVYEAEQTSLRRRVALKILPFAAAIDPRRLQRFKNEALAAANVQHEKIVPVYAVGSERGVHYYAMQFIDGQSLAALIGELRRMRDEQPGRPIHHGNEPPMVHYLAQVGSEPLHSNFPNSSSAAAAISHERSMDRPAYFDRIASLGRQAALALEHAHSVGIVHRDIKPSNLLLDLRGQLWVTDFGLAQVTGDSSLTISGELLGTLRYASPEQLLARRGLVDQRSDIYSLGATLYELVTLRPAFDGRDRNSLLRQVTDEDPVPPAELDASVPAELETIVLKTLRKDPADRYAAAIELGDDLQRFLDRRPIMARRPTPAERLRTWSRRHPSTVTAAAVALLLLSAASLLSTALIRHEQRKTLFERQKAESAYHRERQRAEEAESRLGLARRAVDELIGVSEEELAHRPGMEGLRKRVLASALAYYQEFAEQRRSDPGAQTELRDTTQRIEAILADLAVLRSSGVLYVLAQPSTLDDLKLDAAQREKVTELAARAGKRWSESFGDLRTLPPFTERVRRTLEQARDNEAEIDGILTRSQRRRLRQIGLQAEGLGAFREPEVVDGLKLTQAQRERIRGIEEEFNLTQMREMRSAAASGDNARRRVSRSVPAIDGILSLLTAEQLKLWKDLAGSPIQGPLRPVPMSFGSPRDNNRPPG